VYVVNIKDIERIEVIPGGDAVLYGDGAVNGVVNIITKKNKGTHGRIEQRVGSYKTYITDLGVGTTLGKFNFDLSYRKNKSNSYVDKRSLPGYNQIYRNNADYFSGTVNYNINNTDNFSIKYNLHKENLNNSFPDVNWDFEKKEFYPVALIEERDIKEKNEIIFKYNTEINKNNKLDISTFYQTLKTANYKDTFSLENKLQWKEETFSGDKKIGFNLKDKILYGEDSSLTLGVDYLKNNLLTKYEEKVYGNSSKFDLNQKTLSLFVSNNFKYNKFNFIQGVRFQRIKYGGKIDNGKKYFISKNLKDYSANIGVNYLYSDTGNIYGKYEIGTTSPSPRYNYDYNLDNKTWDYKSNNLKSEITDTLEIGWNDYLFNSLISADIYYSRTKDEITKISIKNEKGEVVSRPYVNIGESRRYGFDLKAEQKFDKITFRESYSYINAKVLKSYSKDTEGKYIRNVSPHRICLAIDYAMTKKLNLTLEGMYTADAYYQANNYDGKRGKNRNVNLRVNYKPFDNLDIYAGVNNIYITRYSYGNLQENAKYYVASPERNYYAGFSYRF
nr:TonB-dependent receptor [Fusobacterium sp.]